MYSKYFGDCVTAQQVKDEYRRLAKRHHPDLNPLDPTATATMQAINAEFDRVCDELTRSERPDKRDSAYEWHQATNVAVRDAIVAALKILRNTPATVEVTGFWIWIHNTQPRSAGDPWPAIIDALKTAGYKWSTNKTAWYLPLAKSLNRSGPWSMDAIRAKYGSAEFNPDADPQPTRSRPAEIG